MDRGLGAAGDDDVGAAGADHLVARADRLGAGGAGARRGCGRRRARRARGATSPAGLLGISIGTVSGRTRRGALLAQGVPRVEQRPDAADAGADGDAEALGVDLGRCRRRPTPRGPR